MLVACTSTASVDEAKPVAAESVQPEQVEVDTQVASQNVLSDETAQELADPEARICKTRDMTGSRPTLRT